MRRLRFVGGALLLLSVALGLGLGAGCSGKTPASPGAKWAQKENWQQLKTGMSMDQVRAILGEPAKVRSDPAFTDWNYSDRPDSALVTFASGILKNWRAPE